MPKACLAGANLTVFFKFWQSKPRESSNNSNKNLGRNSNLAILILSQPALNNHARQRRSSQVPKPLDILQGRHIFKTRLNKHVSTRL